MADHDIEQNDLDEALVAKATLDRYRAKSKQKFREKGGINAALEKQDKEDKAKSLSKSLDRGLKMRMKGDGGHVPNFKEEVEPIKKESIVDLVMVEDEPDAAAYISDIEARMNALVAEKKEEMKRDMFNIAAKKGK